jgi:polyisoprenoid-binding protein YceI
VGRYEVAAARSRLWAEARSSLHPIKTESEGLRGHIEAVIDGGKLNPDAGLKGLIELDVDTLKAGNILYDREIKRQLDVRKFPRIRGEVLEVRELEGGNRYHVRGNLSLHGITRTVEGDVTVKVLASGSLEIEGEKTFDIREFGLTPPKILMLKVYPDVKVRARVVVQPQS